MRLLYTVPFKTPSLFQVIETRFHHFTVFNKQYGIGFQTQQVMI